MTNPCDAFRGQSRSPNILPFDILVILSSCAIVRRATFLIFDFTECRDLEIRVRGHAKSLKVAPLIAYGFLLVFYRNSVPKMHRF